MRARGLVLLLPGLAWLAFVYWRHEQLAEMAKTNPMLLEATTPLRYAILTWVSLLIAAAGSAMLLADLGQWRRNRTNERSHKTN